MKSPVSEVETGLFFSATPAKGLGRTGWVKCSTFAHLYFSLRAMLLAILLPGISMILNGHIFKGIVCGILHLTLIGWIPAAIWAVTSRSQDLAEQRHRETLELLARQGRL
jgi:uncharacterized membrane protein YqaE (UPF0057 family)